MAKQIKSSDIFEGDIFENVRQSAIKTIEVLDKMNAEMKQTAQVMKKELGSLKLDSLSSIKELIKLTEKANQLNKESIAIAKAYNEAYSTKTKAEMEQLAIEKQKQITKQETIKTEREQLKLTRDLENEAKKKAQQDEKAKKNAQDQNNAYKQLERNTRELKNQAKTLGAELRQLELSNQRGTKEWYKTSKALAEVTKKARAGDKALKDIDKSVGDNFRNVGNYGGAINKLSRGLGALGLAFGIGDFVRSAGGNIVEFDQKIQDLVAITGASGSDLEFFKQQAVELGKGVQGGASEVIEAYKLIGSAKPELLSNAEALDQVTQSAITLSQASGMTLPESAKALTDAMNQFGADASQATTFIDALANGALFGSAEIPQVTEAMLKFGAVAKTSGVSVQEATGLIEALAEKGLKGAEAGTSLRNVMLKLSAPDALPKEAKSMLDGLGISFEKLQDTSIPFSERLKELKPLLNDNTALVKTFGTENAVSALNLIQNADRVAELTESMYTQGTALKQSEDRTNTLSFAFNELKESFNGYILELNSSTGASSEFVKVIRFLSKNLGTILDTILLGIKYFGIWKIATYGQIVANKLLASSSEKAFASINAGFQKIGNFLKTNAITIFVTAMITGLMKIKSTLDDLNAPFERINDLNENLASISQKSSEKLGEEKAQLQLLVGQIKSHNAGSEERGKLLQQLNDKYGVHLENIKDETKANQLLDQTQRQIIANLKSQILLQARQEQYTEVIKAVAVAEDEFAKAIASNRAKINKLSDKEIDAWIKRLGGSKSFQEQIEKLSMAEKRRYLIEDNLSSEQLNKKIALEQLQQKELEFEQKLQNQMNANTQSVSQNSVATNTNTGSTNENAKSKKELKTELDKVNESLSKQNELLAQIDEIQARQTIDAKQQEIDIKLANDLKYASESGEIQVDALEQLIEEKFQLEKTAIENQQKEKLALIEQGYTEESRKEREALIKKRDELLAQEEITTEAKKKILASYDKELEQIEMNDLQRNADFELEKVIIADETNQKIVQLEKQKSNEINDVNDKLIDAQIKYYDDLANKSKETNDKITESDKQVAERRREYFQLATDYFIKQSEERIKQIDKEISRAEESSERLKQLAINGNINAKESLAEQERIINEANARKEKEQRRQQRLQLLNTAFSTYQSKVESGSKNPLAETIRDVSLLRAFIETIPAFESGTEDTGANGRGVDGKGGFHAILHPNERVIPKSMNEKIGSLSNEQLTKLAMEYQNGKVIRSNDQVGSSLDTAILINKLDELTETIKMKPETNIEIGEITQSMMEIVRSTKKGNTTTYNRFKIRK